VRPDSARGSIATALYYLGLACLFTHELDAVTHAEWRFLPILQNLPAASATPIFVALHVPLFFVVLWLSGHRREAVRSSTRIIIAAFLVIHAALHFSLSANPAYEFHGGLSRALIFSAGACGLAYLLVEWRSFRRTSSERWHAA
jgi:Family of unknown function (DUF6713)